MKTYRIAHELTGQTIIKHLLEKDRPKVMRALREAGHTCYWAWVELNK